MTLLRTACVLALVALAAAPAVAVTTTEGALLTSLVATAAAKDPAFDVLTRDDIKNALAVESDRQSLGCEESTCLAELAGAMGARIVVYGSVGQLGSDLLLTLNLFDSDKGSSGGRRVAQAGDVSGLAAKIDGTTTDLLQAFLKSGVTAPGTKVKLLVLDLEVKDASPSSTPPATAVPPPGDGPPVMGLVGGGIAALGLVGLGAGVFFDVAAFNADAAARADGVTQKEAFDRFDESETAQGAAAVGYIAGGLAFVLGAGVAVAGLVME
jgi:hypothetical protein